MSKFRELLSRGAEKLIDVSMEAARPFAELKTARQLGVAATTPDIDIQELSQIAAEQIEQGPPAASFIMMELDAGLMTPEEAASRPESYQPPEEQL